MLKQLVLKIKLNKFSTEPILENSNEITLTKSSTEIILKNCGGLHCGGQLSWATNCRIWQNKHLFGKEMLQRTLHRECCLRNLQG